MDIKKTTLKKEDATKHPDSGRRSFIWKAGAAMSAVLATAVPGLARTRINNDTDLKSKVARLNKQVGILEDENDIRMLHRSYENLLDSGMYKEVENLFTDNAEVVFNGGVFKGKNRGVRRLYRDCFSASYTGKKMDQAPGFQLNSEQQENMVEVSKDQGSAKAQFPYSMQVGTPIISDSLLVKMARLQGEGIMKWWEGGIYDVSYAKDQKSGNWKIKRLEYRALSRADYRPGKSCAKPIAVPFYSKVYPEDQAGPDRLITAA